MRCAWLLSAFGSIFIKCQRNLNFEQFSLILYWIIFTIQDLEFSLLNTFDVYLGLQLISVDYQWIDGTMLGYNSWHPGEPNKFGNSEFCAVLWLNNSWADVSCDWPRIPLCEKG